MSMPRGFSSLTSGGLTMRLLETTSARPHRVGGNLLSRSARLGQLQAPRIIGGLAARLTAPPEA